MRTSTRIEHVIAGLDPEAGQRTGAKLRRLQTDCGCREGALFMLATTAATGLYLASSDDPGAAGTIALTLIGVLFGAAAVGKAIGLSIARIRLLVLLRRFERS